MKYEGMIMWLERHRDELLRQENEPMACIIAELLGNTCACDYSGNDEWLPYYCEFAETECPHPSGVACWEQYLLHKDKERREMTNKEAIEQLRERLAITDYKEDIPKYYEAMEMAIDALERQIQKKVVEENLEKFKDGVWIPKKEYFCPTCKSNLGIKEKWRDITDYCPWCGQALDWSEERGE